MFFVCFQANTKCHVERALNIHIFLSVSQALLQLGALAAQNLVLAGIEFSHDLRQKGHFVRRMTNALSST